MSAGPYPENGIRQQLLQLERDRDRLERGFEDHRKQLIGLERANAQQEERDKALHEKIEGLEGRVKSMTTALYGAAATFVGAAITIALAVGQ